MDYDNILSIAWELVEYLEGLDHYLTDGDQENFVNKVAEVLEPFETKERNYN